MPAKPARARSRSASRTQKRTPSPKKQARKSTPGRKASVSPSRKASPGRKAAGTPGRKPSVSRKTPAKKDVSPTAPVRGRPSRSRSNSRPSTPAKGKKGSPDKDSIFSKMTPIKLQSALAAVRRSTSPLTVRPRRAAANAAREVLRGVESSRVIPKAKAAVHDWVPRINWPKWRYQKRRVELHLKRNAKYYFYLIALIIFAVFCYYFQKQITKQLTAISASLQNIYEEQRKRFQTMWEQYMTSQEHAIKKAPPPQKLPPNPHEQQMPAHGV